MGLTPHVVPEYSRFAAVWLQQGRQNADRCRLSRAVGPENSVDAASANVKIDTIHGAVLAE